MFTKKFDELSRNDANIAGGKGASLGEMTVAGLPVPPGFVVLADAFDRFLKETDLGVEIEAIFSKINQHDIASVEHASEKIKSLILNSKMPNDIKEEIEKSFNELGANFVAVRSSATAEDSSAASWAGELESYLNTTENTLLEAVKKCWASLYTPRAIFYRHEKEMHKDHVAVAVVIQKMVQSEVSGITFTVHPVTEDYNQMVIEAGYGLGEAIVGGMITPDTYVVNKKDLLIEDKNISQQEMMIVRSADDNEEKTVEDEKQELQKISDEQIIEISDICTDIESHYGFPCDIEWAYENGKFYVVQSRPITTLNNLESEKAFSIGRYEDYQRLFQWKGGGLPFLISDIFMGHYKTLDGLVIFKDGTWTNFIPKKIKEKTLEDGLERLSSVEKFEKYREDFSNYKKEFIDFLETVIQKQDVTQQEFKNALEFFIKHFFYYSKTEFFYIDKAFENLEAYEAIKKNLSNFEEIKNGGRIFLNNLFLTNDSYLEKILAIISKKFSISPEDLKSYSMKEVGLLFEGQKIDEDTLGQRRYAYIIKVDEMLWGNSASTVIESFLHNEEIENVHEIKGTVANKGKVKGEAFIIEASTENFNDIAAIIERMKEGSVLLADTTSPEIMIACKKASAILTNQGGLMSHAAIVSRELGIPCIVGLGNITDIVKNNDIIEVDADNGIVKFL